MKRMLSKFESFSVFALTGTATGVSLADVEMVLKCLSWAVAIGYAVWKWYSDWRKEQKEQ